MKDILCGLAKSYRNYSHFSKIIQRYQKLYFNELNKPVGNHNVQIFTSSLNDVESNDRGSRHWQVHQQYKDIKLHCKLLHAFEVIKHGFGFKEEEIEEFFYAGKMRINKERVGKRFAKVYIGDVVDLILSVTNDDVTMKRIEIINVTKRDPPVEKKWIVAVRRWKHLKLKRVYSTN